MKNLRGVLGGLLIVVIFQFTLISCTDNSEIIKSQNENAEQIHSKVTPSHGGGGDYDDEDDGV